MTRARLPDWRIAVVAVLPLLGGCIAAAVPVLAGGALVARRTTNSDVQQAGSRAERMAAAETGGGVARADAVNVAAAAARSGVQAPRTAAIPSGGVEGPSPAPGQSGARLTGLTQLPPPSAARAGSGTAGELAASPWTAFAAHAVQVAGTGAAGKTTQSVLLETPIATGKARFAGCGNRAPAVIVDLDPGKASFTPGTAVAATREVRAALERVRAAGIEVIWVSKLPASRSTAVSAALKRSGLDPDGVDRVLLVSATADRKQALRERAGETRCIVAMAGDSRGDFDELFDFLRNPASAAPFETKLGNGWFLAPSPLDQN